MRIYSLFLKSDEKLSFLGVQFAVCGLCNARSLNQRRKLNYYSLLNWENIRFEKCAVALVQATTHKRDFLNPQTFKFFKNWDISQMDSTVDA